MTSSEFRAARLKTGLTQQGLADIMGMTQQSVNRIEHGPRQPTKQHAAAIKMVLIINKHQMLDHLLMVRPDKKLEKSGKI